MKKLILILIANAIVLSASSQVLTYKPYSQFNNDMGAFLKYNFEDRADAYIGKTFDELMKDAQLKPLAFTYVVSYTNNSRTQSIGISLAFKFTSASRAFVPWKDEFITIHWQTSFDYSILRSLMNKYPENKWVNEHYEFFKNLKIKKIYYK